MLLLVLALMLMPALAAATIDPAAVRRAPSAAPVRNTGEVLIRFKRGTPAAVRDSILRDLGIARVDSLPNIGAARARPTRLPVAEAIRRYQGHPAVEYIEPNAIVRTMVLPNDPAFLQMWSLRNSGQTDGVPGFDVNAVPAWAITTGSSSVLVAITDTGLDWRHKDLAPNVWINSGEIPSNGIDDDHNGYVDDVRGWDFANGDKDPMDDQGHGTHVAGTIGAIGNNDLGVAGLNWHVRIMPLKFLNANGEGPLSAAIEAIDYAVRMGARVINASWGTNTYSEALRQAIARAGDAGVLFVAAAGNDGVNNDGGDPYGPPNYPASFHLPNLISVAAFDFRGRMPWWSNYGVKSVDLAAPGVAILSTLPHGNYGFNTGTSMAAPHVTGVAALVLASHPHADAMEVKELILAGVDRVPDWHGLTRTGGRLDALGALANGDSIPPASVNDLAAADVNGTRVTLHWTASGDDGRIGAARRYDLRMSTHPIDAANFASATPVDGLSPPAPGGTPEQFTVRGLAYATTWYFALTARDECGNLSTPSNVAQVTTLSRGSIEVLSGPLEASLATNEKAARHLRIRNAGPSELPVALSVPTGVIWIRTEPSEAVVPAGGDLDVVATLGAPGYFSGDLAGNVEVLSDDPDKRSVSVPARLHVNGYPDIDVPVDTVAFGDVIPGRPLQKWITIRNRGALPLHVSSITTGTGAFTAGLDQATVYGSSPVDVAVTFAPTEAKAYTGALTIASDDPDQPTRKVVFAGRGIPAPHAQVWPSALSDTVATLGSVTRILTLSNPQGSDLRFAAAAEGGAWLTVTPTQGTVASGDSAHVTVTSGAGVLDEGRYDAMVLVRTNDPDHGELRVPVRMDVRRAPDVVISQAAQSLESADDFFVVAPTTVHEFSIPGRTVGEARVELIIRGGWGAGWRGGAQLDFEDVPIGYVGQTDDSCSTNIGDFVVSADEFERLAADGVVHARVVATNSVNSTCMVNQHHIRLTWCPALDTLEFGRVWVGASANLKVLLRNRGLLPLHVQPMDGNESFVVDDRRPLEVAPGDTGSITIRFHPIAVGTASAVLTLLTDDPDRPTIRVPLHGIAAVPPAIALSAPRFDRRLVTGASVTCPLVITNTGGSDLSFDMTLQAGIGALRQRVAPLPMRAAVGAVTTGANPMDGAWVLLVQDVQPWDFLSGYVNENVLSANGIRFTTLTTAGMADADLSMFTKVIIAGDQPTSSYRNLQALKTKIDEFVYRGGTLEFHTGYGWAEGDASIVTLPRGVRFKHAIASTNYMLDPTHPLLAGLPNPIFNEHRTVQVSLSVLQNVPDDALRLVNDDDDRPNLIVYRHGAGTVIASGQPLELPYQLRWTTARLLTNMIPFQAAPEVSWLSADSLSGHIGPGASTTVVLRLDAAGLAGGDYSASLVLRSHESSAAPILLPVTLSVSAAPDIAVDRPVTLESFESYRGDGARTVHTFDTVVPPLGGGNVEMTAIGDFGEPDEFATYRLNGVVVGEAGRIHNDFCATTSATVPVSSATLRRGTASGRVEIDVQNTHAVGTTMCPSNEHRVRLSYSGDASHIAFGTVFLNACGEESFEVINRGATDLHVQPPLVSDPAFRVDPTDAVTIAPGQSQTVRLSFCPSGVGAIQGQITLRSDDPDAHELIVTLDGTGVAPPDVAVTPPSVRVALLPGERATRTLAIANIGGAPLDYRVEIESGSDSVTQPVRSPKATRLSEERWAGILERYRTFRAGRAPARLARAVTTPSTTAPATSATSAPENETVVFFDDMEHGDNGWTHHVTSQQGSDQWVLSSERVLGGRRSWQVSPHDQEGSDALESPVIDLTGHAQARLRFTTWYAFDDCGGVPEDEADGGLVEVSEEGAGSWTPIAPVNGYPWVIDPGCNNPLGGRPAYAHHSAAGDSSVIEEFDLSAFAGKRIRIRFNAGWDCGNCEITQGWFIDDVRVTTDAPSWISASPPRGDIASDDVADVALSFTTTLLSPGTRQAKLRVRSNDPDQPVVTVPIEVMLASVGATADVSPKTVNLVERRKWLQVLLELPRGLDPVAINPTSLRLNDARSDPAFAQMGDKDHDGIPDLTVRFALDDVRSSLQPTSTVARGAGELAPVVLTGALRDGTTFLGRDTLRVVHPRLAAAGDAMPMSNRPLRLTWSASAEWAGTRVRLEFSRNNGVTWLPIADSISAAPFDWRVVERPTRHGLLRAEFRDSEGLLATDLLERSIGAADAKAPGAFQIERMSLRAAPNPFSDGAEITLALPRAGAVDLAVYDVNGRRVRTLLHGTEAPGLLSMRWDGRDAHGARLSSGIYYLRVRTADATATWRTTLLR